MKNSIQKSYRVLGKLLFLVTLPLLRKVVKHTERSYVMVFCGQDILLVRSWLSRQAWELPGGGVKADEGLAAAAQREAQEEVGIKLKAVDLLLTVSNIWTTDRLGFRYSIFASTTRIKPKLSHRRMEIIDTWWFPLDQLPKNVSAEVLQAIKIHQSTKVVGND
jgi:8-oxo-dGTP pyrophosphatase MutT (NUDIX family)